MEKQNVITFLILKWRRIYGSEVSQILLLFTPEQKQNWKFHCQMKTATPTGIHFSMKIVDEHEWVCKGNVI